MSSAWARLLRSFMAVAARRFAASPRLSTSCLPNGRTTTDKNTRFAASHARRADTACWRGGCERSEKGKERTDYYLSRASSCSADWISTSASPASTALAATPAQAPTRAPPLSRSVTSSP